MSRRKLGGMSERNSDLRRGRRQRNIIESMEPRLGGLLESLKAGRTVQEAAREAGLTPQAVHGRMQWDAEFGQKIEAARAPHRRAAPQTVAKHSAWGYRRGCRCEACTTAHADAQRNFRHSQKTSLGE